jgi:hypothetical protein
MSVTPRAEAAPDLGGDRVRLAAVSEENVPMLADLLLPVRVALGKEGDRIQTIQGQGRGNVDNGTPSAFENDPPPDHANLSQNKERLPERNRYSTLDLTVLGHRSPLLSGNRNLPTAEPQHHGALAHGHQFVHPTGARHTFVQPCSVVSTRTET